MKNDIASVAGVVITALLNVTKQSSESIPVKNAHLLSVRRYDVYVIDVIMKNPKNGWRNRVTLTTLSVVIFDINAINKWINGGYIISRPTGATVR